MLLKILWILDALVLLTLIASYFLGEAEKGKFIYVLLYIALIVASYKMRVSHPKMAIALASLPVAIPVLIVLFLFIVFNISAIFK